MAVVSANENWASRTARQDRINTVYTRSYQVITNDIADSQVTVLAAADLPVIGAQHPDDTDALVRNRDAKPEREKPSCWTVTITYERSRIDLPGNNAEGELEDPTDEPAEIDINHTTVRRVIYSDKDGNPFDNSAGEEFETPTEEDRYLPTIRISRIVSRYSLITANNFINAVNDAQVKIAGNKFAARTLCCVGLPARRVLVRGSRFWQLDYLFIADPDTWDLSVLDAGYKYLNGGNLLPYHDDAGQSLVRPGFLDGSTGAKSSTPQYVTFRVKREVNFSQLGLSNV